MKKLHYTLKSSFCLLALLMMMSSCFVSRFEVGHGPETAIVEKGKNHFFLFGLIPGNKANIAQLADDKENYEITYKHSPVDVLLSFITIFIYTPTTVVVER